MGKSLSISNERWSLAVRDFQYEDEDLDGQTHDLMGRARLQIDSMAEEEGYE